MAPQKRKQLHDAGVERSASDAPPRRSTRQHPAIDPEPSYQSRSGRLRVSNIEEPHGEDVARPLSGGRRTDAPKPRVAAPTDPAVATMTSTRTTRHNKVTASADIGIGAASVLPVSKENIRPPTPPDDEEKHVAPAQSKLSRHHHSTQTRSRSRSRSPSQSGTRRTSSTLQSRTFTARSSQRPAPAPCATTTTPKRTPSKKVKATKPPGTPRSDRNIDEVVFGNTCFKAWYPSYYGKEVLGDISANAGGNAKFGGGKRELPFLDRLYICPCCFKYSKEMIPWWKHVQYCERKGHVPGTKIYTHPRQSQAMKIPHIGSSTSTSPSAIAKGKGKSRGDDKVQSAGVTVSEGEWSVWEVDGGKDGLFCQNLSLFAKLFLDNKSVFFDVRGFNYFLLVYTPPLSETHTTSPTHISSHPESLAEPENTTLNTSNPPTDVFISLSSHPRPQIVGFFSKEQMSWDNNNLACILVFPPWQRKGLGALLMGVSYEISRREGILGGPEKPISELGRKGYKRFWAGEIVRWILELDVPTSSVQSVHAMRHARKEKEKENNQVNNSVAEQEDLIIDVEQCSRHTWIVPEDCLAVLREMGVIEEAEVEPPRDGGGGGADVATYGKEKEEKEAEIPKVPRIRINKAAVRKWAQQNKIDLTRACDPDGFVEGYAIKQDEENNEEE
ncbi:acyl-CoA N-acyltransferase [Xylaria bambusicola]|uniref:acyl-CoA N-acyltransferase n=1 Tax=Xylaria bambusicola TaxID=326684 RepID=UPI0020078436|nr:acyl-CoA N-acyltransferase [Xylaria bambusicola]KAI0516967.1 acyl-CoA N-acyltransferase [Xylaria bambusicola]